VLTNTGTITGGTAGASATYSVALTGSPTNVILKVCADHENELVKAWVSPTVNEYAAWDDTDPGAGRYCAIGHNNVGHQNRFDNFSIEELRRGDTVCVSCFCVCDTYAMPPNLTATIVFAEDRSECLQDETWDMDAVLGPQQLQLDGGITICTDTLNFRLTCGDSTPNSFTLMHLTPFNCLGESTKNADVALSTCEPLALYYFVLGALAFPLGYCLAGAAYHRNLWWLVSHFPNPEGKPTGIASHNLPATAETAKVGSPKSASSSAPAGVSQGIRTRLARSTTERTRLASASAARTGDATPPTSTTSVGTTVSRSSGAAATRARRPRPWMPT
jgi:hypothetical protein